ncbi:MAG: class I SAM-dependent methyltransferase [Candidatus Bathyarchaeia archaeon]
MGEITGDFYDEEYYTKGTKSHYGHGKISPYTHPIYMQVARRQAHILKFLFQPHKVLVVGCALGYLVRALREIGVKAYGIDISRWAIEHAPKYLKPFLVLGNACDMHMFPTRSFDLVVAYDVLEHIPMPNLSRAISECCRVCNEFFVFNGVIRDDGIDKSHVSVFPPEWWIAQVACQGFQLLFKKIEKRETPLETVVCVFRRLT